MPKKYAIVAIQPLRTIEFHVYFLKNYSIKKYPRDWTGHHGNISVSGTSILTGRAMEFETYNARVLFETNDGNALLEKFFVDLL